jgi:methionyl-tRNA synthetase
MEKSKFKEKVLVTSGLPYSNGRLHVGHVAGAYLPADIFVRYLKLRGKETLFVCGSDDHGAAIMLSAQKEGKEPGELAKHYHDLQKKDFEGLGIHFDVFGSTSRNPYHQKASQEFFLKTNEKGYFEKKKSRQFFDEKDQIFLPDRFVQGTCGFCKTPDQYGDQCENCGKMLDVDSLKDPKSTASGAPASVRETVHWFLDLSRFEDEVSSWVEKGEMREHTRNYVKSLVSGGMVKRSMTRDLTWGVPVPLDDPDAQGKALYVWFDAPIGYVSNTMQVCEEKGEGAEAYENWWKSDQTDILHFIGEDNTIFHCIVWIAMLSAEGSFKLPRGVIVNQFLNIQFPGKEEEKISKSRGTAVWIGDYLAEGGDPDILRYYLTTVAPERFRTAYNPADLIQKNNTDLANVIGNFVNRILRFNAKHVGAEVPKINESKLTEVDREFYSHILQTHEKVTRLMEDYSFKSALHEIMELGRACNKYVDDKAPWVTRKTDMDTTEVTLNYAIQAMRTLATLLQPFMPKKAEALGSILGLKLEEMSWEQATEWLPTGHALGEPEILFQKIEEEK